MFGTIQLIFAAALAFRAAALPAADPNDDASACWTSSSAYHDRSLEFYNSFSTELVSRSVLVTLFSTPRTTPSLVWIPMAVLPSLMASREYSTWKRRPSGEKVLGSVREAEAESFD